MDMPGATLASLLARIIRVALIAATLATAGLRIFAGDLRLGDRPAWLIALGCGLALLAARLVTLIGAARRGELPVPRVLLPAIFLVEGLGVWLGDGAAIWQQIRVATAIALELGFIALAIHHLVRTPTSDELPEVRLARPLAQLLPPRAARLIAFELVVLGSALRFVLGGWRRPLRAGFTYHRESVLRLLLPTLPLLAIGDIALLELVILPHATMWIRIAVHAVAIYGLFWVIGLWASFRARPHRITDGRLTLHRGLLRHVELAVSQIASIAPMPAFSDDWKLRAYRKDAGRFDVAGGTVFDVRLSSPVEPIGLLGPDRPSDHLILTVDDPASFLAALTAAT
jgi:hypothetical protein